MIHLTFSCRKDGYKDDEGLCHFPGTDNPEVEKTSTLETEFAKPIFESRRWTQMMKFARFPWEQICTQGLECFHLIWKGMITRVCYMLQEYRKEGVAKVGRVD